jgi:group II intron reverse transcriptase/maturase
MLKAEKTLRAINKLGEKNIPLTRVYRCLFDEELYLLAYGKLYKNKGALTAGVTDETIDGMNLKRIREIIELMRDERFNFNPARRTYVPKKNKGKRPLGLPTFSDKIVQEVVRLILEAYYEPQFSRYSHGFRPNKGCHTALKEVKKTFTGTTWFIEGDIKDCFTAINHDKLEEILSKKIHDGRFLNLIKRMLKAGYLEEWTFNETYSGVPQGGVVSPILSNIYLNELDQFYEKELKAKYTKGKKRKKSKAYCRISTALLTARKKNDRKKAMQLKKQQLQTPSVEPFDENYRRLKYVRYGDDFILGFIGSKKEAEGIKDELSQFLRAELKLEMSDEKTLITHAGSRNAKFLGYEIRKVEYDGRITRTETGHKKRALNGNILLTVSPRTVAAKVREYQRNGITKGKRTLYGHSEAEIIDYFQSRYRGFAEYYKYANNRAIISRLQYKMQISLVKTLANKLRIGITRVYQRFASTKIIDGQKYKTLSVKVKGKNGKEYEFYWGGISLKIEPVGAYLEDRKPLPLHYRRTELVQRLSADTCEHCHSHDNIEVHHIRKLADLKRRWKGRKKKPDWVVWMITRNRKTMVLCQECHIKLHSGKL